MKKTISLMTEIRQLSAEELIHLRGGRRLSGPGDTVADDIDMPDLTNTPGPGDTVADDIDMPDLTMTLNPVPIRRAFGRSMRFENFAF